MFDCGDNSCMFAISKGGMRTNGGCRCLEIYSAHVSECTGRVYRQIPLRPHLFTHMMKVREKIIELEGKIEELEDEIANREINLLEKFSPGASDKTDLYTFIDCLVAENKRLKDENKDLIDKKVM